MKATFIPFIPSRELYDLSILSFLPRLSFLSFNPFISFIIFISTQAINPFITFILIQAIISFITFNPFIPFLFYLFGVWWDQIYKAWLLFGLIYILGAWLCHIMASNGNKYIKRVQWWHKIMRIHKGRAIINIQPKLGLWQIFIAGFLLIFCIYLNKERSY